MFSFVHFFSCPPYNSWNSSYVLNFPAIPSHDNQIPFFPVNQESRNNRDQCPLSPYTIYLMCAHLLHLLYLSRPKPSHLLKAMATSFLSPSPSSTQIPLLTASAEITQYVVVSPFMSRGEHLPPLPASTPPPPSFSILYNSPKVKLALVSCKLPLGGFGFGQWLILHSSWCSRKQNSDSRGLRSAHHPDASTPNQKAYDSTCKSIHSSCGLLALQPQIALFHHH